MLRSLKDLEHYTLSATDGEIGSVDNFLFDDERWTIRYLVADTGGFLDGRQVLISPISFRETDWSLRHFHLALTKDKIAHSPSIDWNKPVSRQHERSYYGYFRYPYYWGYPGAWGLGVSPAALAAAEWSDARAEDSDRSEDVHLRSAREVRGYHVQGNDGAIGHVEDFIIDDETWEVRYLVVDTKNWWFGRKVLVGPHWAKSISWEQKKVHVDLSRGAIENSPEWDGSSPINREYEAHLYDYYGRPVYWDSGDRPPGPGAGRPAHHSGSQPR
jgi:hypothetical protein